MQTILSKEDFLKEKVGNYLFVIIYFLNIFLIVIVKFIRVFSVIFIKNSGVEKLGVLAGPITRRSVVQIHLPLFFSIKNKEGFEHLSKKQSFLLWTIQNLHFEGIHLPAIFSIFLFSYIYSRYKKVKNDKIENYYRKLKW